MHQGKIIQKEIANSGKTIDEIAKLLHYKSRSTIYDHFKKEILSEKVLLRYAKVLKSADIYSISGVSQQKVEIHNGLAKPSSIDEAVEQRDYYYKLYLESLEKIRLLKRQIEES
ncbi:MAG: hypothetical protein LCH58_15945 [Bacteroidetes bacterium]|uniref:hypothetical protein n=1 Tax=Phnomibacter sp. TaxID=2836217 RepID=UPI002FDE56C4|nr:hypothetical protein [Bacteroidota bacterium]